MLIYTYANPFTLNDEPFWCMLKENPHFCVSQTLVQGLCRHYGRHSFSYICTADKIINTIYPEWYQNVELKIEQYVSVSRQIAKIKDANLAKAFKFNQQELVEALRFALTLHLTADDFNDQGLPKEQLSFLDILRAISQESCWVFDDGAEVIKERLIKSILDIHNHEMQDALSIIIAENNLRLDNDSELANKVVACLEALNSKRDDHSLRQCKVLEHHTALAISPKIDFSRVVFHGIHQFTPKILSVIKALEVSGIEVAFLFNYQPKFSHVYGTWRKVYEWSGCDLPKQQASNDFDCRLIGECIGNMLEGRRSGDVRHESNILSFANKTEFSDYVAACFEIGATKSKHITLALSNMDEQFYGARSESINEILKFYFPEQFGDRHFLSYPIGQFILSLYNLDSRSQHNEVGSETSIALNNSRCFLVTSLNLVLRPGRLKHSIVSSSSSSSVMV